MACQKCEAHLPIAGEEGDSVTVPCCGTTWEYNADEDGGLVWENTIDGEVAE